MYEKVVYSQCPFPYCYLEQLYRKTTEQQSPTIQAKGGIKYGGILRVNEIDRFKSLMPIAISEQNAYHIASQVYEGLVKYNQFDLSFNSWPC